MDAYQKLEREFAKAFSLRYDRVVACANGTAALHIALEALQLRPRSQVIVPEFTMVACARACTMADLKPVFVDCDETLNLNPSKLLECLTPATTAVMPVHIYGRPCDMNAVITFARLNGLKVIEDMSEVHGLTPSAHSDAACWSFYRNKIIAGEEGGMVWFADGAAADRARCIRSHGFTPAHDFLHEPRGHNYRLSNLHAKVILGSLRAMAYNLDRRREVVKWYDELVPDDWKMPYRPYPWVYDMRLPEGVNTGEVVSSLVRSGVPARAGFKPMSEQPEYRGHYSHLEAYRQSRRVIYLPVVPTMTRDDVAAAARLWA